MHQATHENCFHERLYDYTTFPWRVFSSGLITPLCNGGSWLHATKTSLWNVHVPLPLAPRSLSLRNQERWRRWRCFSSFPQEMKVFFFFTFPILNFCRMQVNCYLKVLGISRSLIDIHMPWQRTGEFPELQLRLPLIHRVKLIQLNKWRQVLSHKLISEDYKLNYSSLRGSLNPILSFSFPLFKYLK